MEGQPVPSPQSPGNITCHQARVVHLFTLLFPQAHAPAGARMQIQALCRQSDGLGTALELQTVLSALNLNRDDGEWLLLVKCAAGPRNALFCDLYSVSVGEQHLWPLPHLLFAPCCLPNRLLPLFCRHQGESSWPSSRRVSGLPPTRQDADPQEEPQGGVQVPLQG
jgi:hypothetical protein